jgi:hypothetical protein
LEGLLIGIHADIGQVVPFQVIALTGQGGYDREFGGHGFLHPVSIVLGELTDKGWEVGFMVFSIKP